MVRRNMFSDEVVLTYCHRKFSQADVNPEVSWQDPTQEEEDASVQLPSRDLQAHLLRLYFTYVHPFFPVVHKQDFLHHYNS